LTTKSVSELKLPGKWWPSDWSADGKRVLATTDTGNGAARIAWVNVDGTGDPEFVTAEDEIAYGARLSPENRRILCLIYPKSAKGQRYPRLYVIDLISKSRTVIDRPGITQGYCWSSDGRKVAYTWQAPLPHPEQVKQRRTYLIASDPDGSNRRTVTSRTYEVAENDSDKEGVTFFFQVFAWWR
jgi:Tol biopolymer transport system component